MVKVAEHPTLHDSDVAGELNANNIWHSFDNEPVLQGVNLKVLSGQTVVLLGPSGCGKTTLLRVLAGLETPSQGAVMLGDRTLTSETAVVSPERRNIGMVFQDGALFPHLTVEQNVAFGVAKHPDRSSRVKAALDLVHLYDLRDRSPAQLSGGQRQRVALARTLAPRPTVLLLDEPFSSLDAELRVSLRTEVHGLLHDLAITTVFVTHDQEEAFVLGDQVAVMRDGKILQFASPDDLYSAPTTEWVAEFIGAANLLVAQAQGITADTAIGTVPLKHDASGNVRVLVRPEHLVMEDIGPWEVRLVEFYGHDTLYLASKDEFELRIRTPRGPQYRHGDMVEIRYNGPDTEAYSI